MKNDVTSNEIVLYLSTDFGDAYMESNFPKLARYCVINKIVLCSVLHRSFTNVFLKQVRNTNIQYIFYKTNTLMIRLQVL